MSTKNVKNVFREGAISATFVGEAIGKHQTKTTIGAHNIFLGQVRADKIGENEVEAIEYTANEEMANQKFHDIREETFDKFNLTCMHIYHSKGIVKAGEICLFVFVSSPSRKHVFEAIEYIVERIKKEVPIFGKELFKTNDNSDKTHQWKVNS